MCPAGENKEATEISKGAIMATMRAVQVTSPKAPLEIVERPIPEPGPGTVRIKVQACGICHSDSFVKEGTFPGIQYPASLRARGGRRDRRDRPRRHRLEPGQRVGVGWNGGYCGHCDHVPARQFLRLRHRADHRASSFDGGYAEYMIARATASGADPPTSSPRRGAP